MENIRKPATSDGSRLTIGYLHENRYDEYGNQTIAGFFDAAERNGVNAVCFSYYASHSAFKDIPQIQMVLDFINQYPLDGLLFIGWSRAVNSEDPTSFLKHFKNLSFVALGTEFPGIPSVYFPGNLYFKELLLHLINVHKFTRIAYIPPSSKDSRNEAYIDTLKEHGIFRPELMLDPEELEGLGFPLRAKRSLSILLDERKVSFDVIMSMFSDETIPLMRELEARGYNIPRDIAVTGYEDGLAGKFHTPSLTTIYFPWKELAYSGCENLVRHLNNEDIPISTSIPGKVIYRNSCGCLSSPVKHARMDYTITPATGTGAMVYIDKEILASELQKNLPEGIIDINMLLEAFLADYEQRSYDRFLDELESQFRKVPFDGSCTETENFVSILRSLVLPCFKKDIEKLAWAENLFSQGQVLIREKSACFPGNAEVHATRLHMLLHEIGQILTAKHSINEILDSLEENLPRVNIPGCYIIVFNSSGSNAENPYDDCSLIFEYCDGARIKSGTGSHMPAGTILSGGLFPKDRSYKMIAHLLQITDEFIGFVLYEPGPMDERIYQALTAKISSALKSAILIEKLDSSYKQLVDQAHREGMAEIATGILHNVGNVLNSINSSLYVMKNMASSQALDDFLQANGLLSKNIDNLREFILNDPRGEKLLKFYLKLGVPISDIKKQMGYHTNRLDEKIVLINDIIKAQQNYAGFNSTTEELDIVSVLEDVLRMQTTSLEEYNIKVVRDYRNIPKVLIQRTKMFHILVNLIKNAKEAMLGNLPGNRMLILATRQDESGKYLRVTDTGYGIPEALLKNIFAYGYTTKVGGHGFGLHSSANYMAEMGGKLWAESEGPGKGSTFVVQFR